MFECARYLAQRGHSVDVFANRWEEDGSDRINYHYVPMPKQPPFLRVAWYYRAASRLLRGHEYDVLNVHGCICPTGGVHWVQSLHCSWLERCRGFRKPLSAAALRQRMNPLHPILLRLEAAHFRERRYQKLIATTPQVREDLNRWYGVPSEDVVIIPNGFSPEEFNPQRRAARRSAERARLGLNDDHVTLLLAANELERKGYGTILAAMRQLGRHDLRLLVVGRPDPGQVKKLAADAGLAEQVIACGHTSDIAAFHAAADLFVLPTQYEAFSLAILEALGSGLPVITTRVPGACDAIEAGVNGALIDDPNDGEELAAALEPLLNPDRREALAGRCAPSVRQYQWPLVLARYEQLLLEHVSPTASLHKATA
jgi:UDP-glucose:(heptosyl)LPS alpha-1,3-glucosyltransferase